MTKPHQQESTVEHYLLTQCRQNGFLCLKFVSPGRIGVPDRIIVSPVAGTVFVEVKRPGGRVRKSQQLMHAKMRRCGADVRVIDSTVKVDTLIAHLLAGDAADAPVMPEEHRL
ncbi:VRR-NUC domain-containing protein [Streptomyces sp. NRRL F-5053]|uniref:VRR-NUC domain-containing protein n=1 Tax=Streptomyces sp. NRRL F-5053 TaxID=1463854 RepID=UPI0004C913E5|nr:VRR-NUC domain-containing protein [Streptomyces sp. NRRL F-5053]